MLLPLGTVFDRVADLYWEIRRKLRRVHFGLQKLFGNGPKSKRLPSDIDRGYERTLYIDLTVIHSNDAGTGIQRVVRALALALLRQPMSGWKIQFVGASRKRPYHAISWPNGGRPQPEKPMAARPGDIFLGLDYSLDTVRHHWRQLAAFGRGGGSLWFLIHDLLPNQRPDWFSRQTVRRYRAWIDVLDHVADGFLCNSEQTQRELQEELGLIGAQACSPATVVLPMGHDILESNGEKSLCSMDMKEGKSWFDDRKYFLTVGTVEPRKGHADLLKAFDVLWKRGFSHDLVLIGRLGWHVEELRRAIVSHPQFGKRLIWLDDADDGTLVKAYEMSAGVIISSHGEGFGLPLIEALGHRKPVLARDLPIFRAREESGVCFFPADAEASVIADRIAEWSELVRQGLVHIVPPCTSWEDSARVLLQALGLERPYAA
jgi:glycosyltransferase involved in cell wall biosynthesis